MRRLVIAALLALAVCVVAGTALAAGSRSSVIYDSTAASGAPTNQVSYGPEAYSFKTIGGQITFVGTARSLSNVTVTLSSWACQTGTWEGKNCFTQSGATFPQEMTLKIYDAASYSATSTPIATSTQTFAVPYRPSASPKCVGADAGKWMTPSKDCKNGLADDVTFSNFSPSHVTLPDTVVYEISYNTNHHGPIPTGVAGPSDSLNVAITGTNSPAIWTDGALKESFGNYTPAVQFKAGNAN